MTERLDRKRRKGKGGLWSFLKSRLDGAGNLLETEAARRRDQERAIVDSLAGEVHRRGLGTAGIFIAESAKPLSYLVAQGIHFFTPHAGLLVDERRIANMACLLEDRGNLERFAVRLEALAEAEKRRR